MACCPSIWWCTASGPEEVSPDGDGLYTRPADAVGHPFKSLEDAAAACPVPDVALLAACGDCIGVTSSCSIPWSLPGVGYSVSFVNRTGAYLNFPNSVDVLRGVSANCPGTSGLSCASGSCVNSGPDYGCVDGGGVPGLTIDMQFCVDCNTIENSGRLRCSIVIPVAIPGVPLSAVLDPGWTGGVCGSCIGSYCANSVWYGCGSQFPDTQLIGTFTSGSDSVDVYLTRIGA